MPKLFCNCRWLTPPHFFLNCTVPDRIDSQEQWLLGWLGSSIAFPSTSHLRNEQIQQAVPTVCGSEHNARNHQGSAFYIYKSMFGVRQALYLHHLRQMPHDISTGTLESESHKQTWRMFTKQSYGEQRSDLHAPVLQRLVLYTIDQTVVQSGLEGGGPCISNMTLFCSYKCV